MEAEGVLERRPHPADRRARCLYLTAKAKPLLGEMWRLGDLTRSEMFEGVNTAERHAFMAVLERMHDNLARLEGKAPAPELLSADHG
jgi:DNA-binding MarR family transcriptional regulator